jgi:hypothetical protein
MQRVCYIEQQFVEGVAPSSRLIAYASGGPKNRAFSHTDAVLPDALWGARWDKVGGQRSGFYPRPFDYGSVKPVPGQERWARRLVMRLPCSPAQRSAWISFHEAQYGKPYDWRAICAFGFQRNWREDDAWFCSEEGCAALEEAIYLTTYNRRFYLPAAKVGPTALAGLMSAMGAYPVIDEFARSGSAVAA